MSKLFFKHRFPGFEGTVSTLEDGLAKFHLGGYARFIAFSQICIGVLLLTQRFATLGAIMLFPMLLNILMIAASLGWQSTCYINLTLLLLNAYLLSADFHKLKFIFSDADESIAKVPFVVRTFPFHDIVFVIGATAILISPYISYVHVWLAYIIAALGLATCIGIHLYDKRLWKEITELK